MKVQGFQDYPVPVLSPCGQEKGSGQRIESKTSSTAHPSGAAGALDTGLRSSILT